MRILRFCAALALLSAPLQAQDLQRPEGWLARFDRAGSSEADMEMWVTMPPGWHITTGPAGIFWNPGHTAAGEFEAEMDVFLFDPNDRREAFGLFVGGTDLQGEGQSYLYFLIRDGGQFLVKKREGSDTPTLLQWTGHPAIRSYADRGDDASVQNVLTVRAEAESVHFLVNGQEVAKLPRAGLSLDGVVGIRANHALNLHVSRLEVRPLG